MALLRGLLAPRGAACTILAAAAATIAGALIFEYGFGLTPCPLCLMQRKPYYGAMAVSLVVALAPMPERLSRVALAILAAIFLISAGLGTYHAGVEWGWWTGPADCSGGAPAAADVNDFLNSLQKIRVVSCTEAAWRFAGLSLAGWNVLISLTLAAFAAWAARPTAGRSVDKVAGTAR